MATLYELTDLGRSLDLPLAAVAEWAERYWEAVEAARSRWERLSKAGARRRTFALTHPGTPSHFEVRCLA
jgi:hypothetical protein